jgi:hypothetical protein
MDLSWLQNEAKTIHAIFEGIFYSFCTVLVLVAVVTDYFKIPLGGTPSFVQLIGRVFVAALLLHAFPEITNAVADFTDSLAAKVGNLAEIKHVVNTLGDRFSDLSWSWTSVRQMAVVVVSYLTFFLVYISVYLASAGVLYVWVLLYVFSPLMIALYVHPATAGATKALFRSLFEVSAWKITWATLAALLWSTARMDISKADDLSLLTLISYNLLLAISVLLTPIVVSALFSKGITAMTSSMLGMAAGAAVMSPGALTMKSAAKSKDGLKFTGSAIGKGYGAAKGGIASVASRFSGSSSKKSAPKTRSSQPPRWHNQIPPPKEPPPWLAKKLEQEKQRKK